MIALTTLIYCGVILVFYKVFKIKVNAKNVAFFTVVGVTLIGGILILWKFASPSSSSLVVNRYTIQLVPQVKGPITKIHAEPNVPLKKGKDILFEIQPDLYQFALQQAKGNLRSAEKNLDTLQAAIRAAEAGVKKSEASLAASKAELEVAEETQRINPSAVAKIRITQLTEGNNAAKAALDQAKAGEEQANFALKSAQEQIVSLTAQVATAQFNLDQCIVYAPADGFVTQWAVREGTMAVSMPFAPVGTFIDTSRINFLATFPQNVIRFAKKDDPVEVTLKSRPGEVFTGKVEAVVNVTGEGQLNPSGTLVETSALQTTGKYFVKFQLDDEEVAESLGLGTAGTVAIYTDKGKPFHIISKVTVRINAWMYYLNPF